MKIDGLLSGHSGADIDKERGNAIKLAVRILYELQKMEECRNAVYPDFKKEKTIIQKIRPYG